jgi:hypothetical protein
LDSVLKNTSTWVSSMTPQLVFMVWTSTSYSLEPERESPEESQELESSVTSKRSARKSLSNGSLRSSEVLFSEVFDSSLPNLFSFFNRDYLNNYYLYIAYHSYLNHI